MKNFLCALILLLITMVASSVFSSSIPFEIRGSIIVDGVFHKALTHGVLYGVSSGPIGERFHVYANNASDFKKDDLFAYQKCIASNEIIDIEADLIKRKAGVGISIAEMQISYVEPNGMIITAEGYIDGFMGLPVRGFDVFITNGEDLTDGKWNTLRCDFYKQSSGYL